MERKSSGSVAVAVTKEEVRSALGRARTLTSEEEKTVRMRHGVSAPKLDAPLPRAAAGNDELEDELLVIEMQLMRAWKRRLQEQKGLATAAQKAPATGVAVAVAEKPQVGSSRTKDKIVRALRKKK